MRRTVESVRLAPLRDCDQATSKHVAKSGYFVSSATVSYSSIAADERSIYLCWSMRPNTDPVNTRMSGRWALYQQPIDPVQELLFTVIGVFAGHEGRSVRPYWIILKHTGNHRSAPVGIERGSCVPFCRKPCEVSGQVERSDSVVELGRVARPRLGDVRWYFGSGCATNARRCVAKRAGSPERRYISRPALQHDAGLICCGFN